MRFRNKKLCAWLILSLLLYICINIALSISWRPLLGGTIQVQRGSISSREDTSLRWIYPTISTDNAKVYVDRTLSANNANVNVERTLWTNNAKVNVERTLSANNAKVNVERTLSTNKAKVNAERTLSTNNAKVNVPQVDGNLRNANEKVEHVNENTKPISVGALHSYSRVPTSSVKLAVKVSDTNAPTSSVKLAYVKVADNNVNVADTNVNVADNNVKVMDNNVKVADNNVKVMDNNVNVADNNVKVMDNNVKVVDNNVKVVDNNVKVADNDVKMANNNVKVVDNNVKVEDNIVKVAVNNVNVKDNNVKVMDNNVKVADNNVKVADTNDVGLTSWTVPITEVKAPYVLTAHNDTGKSTIHHTKYIPPKPATTEPEIAKRWLRHWQDTVGNFTFQDDINIYFTTFGTVFGTFICLTEGTDLKRTGQIMRKLPQNVTLTHQTNPPPLKPEQQQGGCVCLSGWYGTHCSVPQVVVDANPKRSPESFKLRASPRRIIQHFLYLNEEAMLAHRLYDTGDLVDAFLVQDAIYTGFGDPKNISFIPHLLTHSFPEHIRRKVVPQVMFHYPRDRKQGDWAYEYAMREYFFRDGTLPEELKDISEDDMLVTGDADEVPSRETLLFLKLHQNIPQPVMVQFLKTDFGFFWYYGETTSFYAATFGLMKTAFKLSPTRLRRNDMLSTKSVADQYLNSRGSSLGPLTIGTAKHPGGFHCSYCSTAQGIRDKLIMTIDNDFPRYGDHPLKCTLPYIQSVIGRGMWFNEERCFDPRSPSKPHYAPDYLMRNPGFEYLLYNPYANATTTCKSRPREADKGPFVKYWHRMDQKMLDEILLHNRTYI